MVAITGNVNLNLLEGSDSFQEVDITGVTMPITKHNFIVKKIENTWQIPFVRHSVLRRKAEKVLYSLMFQRTSRDNVYEFTPATKALDEAQTGSK